MKNDNDLDDIFGNAIDINREAFDTGINNGKIEGKNKSIKDSLEYGKDYGYKIGNELGYYKTILEILSQKYIWKNDKTKIRFENIKNKIVDRISTVQIDDIYKPIFEESMMLIRTWFKKSMMIVNLKTEKEQNEDFEF